MKEYISIAFCLSVVNNQDIESYINNLSGTERKVYSNKELKEMKEVGQEMNKNPWS